MHERSRTLVVGTWNIGGGILGDSHQIDGKSEVDYHCARIQDWAPDILCLQEAHEFGDGRPGQSKEIATVGGFAHERVRSISPSHLDPNAELSLSVLSRHEIRGSRYVKFTNPGFTATGPNGQQWILFDKGYLITEVQLPEVSVTIVNAHCFPLHYFGASAVDREFEPLWRDFASELLALSQKGPVIAAIDLNHEPIDTVLGEIFQEGKFRNSFSLTATVPKGGQQDYIVYTSADAQLLETSVIQTESDHHYCQSRFSL